MADIVSKNKKMIRCRRLDNSDERGVAATVGTIMALLVFLSLMSMITQQYIPVWMEDKEAYHMDEVMSQFAQLKGSIDNLVMNDFTEYPLYSYVRLGSEGVPMFASKTPGILHLSQEIEGMKLSFNTTDGPVTQRATGRLSLEVLNRYFEPQTVIYEHGAIILEQSERAVIRGRPPISIDKFGDTYSIRLNMIDIDGSDHSIGGTGAVGITTELYSSSRRNIIGDISNVTISLSTRNPDAWIRWFISETDLEEGDISAPEIIEDGPLHRIVINLDNVGEIRYTHSRVNMKIST